MLPFFSAAFLGNRTLPSVSAPSTQVGRKAVYPLKKNDLVRSVARRPREGAILVRSPLFSQTALLYSAPSTQVGIGRVPSQKERPGTQRCAAAPCKVPFWSALFIANPPTNPLSGPRHRKRDRRTRQLAYAVPAPMAMARVWSIFCEHWPRETFTVASDPCELKFPVDIDECFRRLKISKQKELLDVYCEELLSWTYLSTSCRQARELIRHRFDYIRSPRPFWQLCVFDWCFVCVTLIQDAKRNIAGRMWDNAATYLAANEVLSGLSHLPGFERAVATIARDIPLDTDTDSDADSGESSGSDDASVHPQN